MCSCSHREVNGISYDPAYSLTEDIFLFHSDLRDLSMCSAVLGDMAL
jgi:hypothetical protein